MNVKIEVFATLDENGNVVRVSESSTGTQKQQEAVYRYLLGETETVVDDITGIEPVVEPEPEVDAEPES